MKKLILASGLFALSLAAATSAEAACRQVYGGTSCNWMGKCWHNPPKTVCDAPKPAPIAQRPVVQPGSNLISNNQGRVISTDGAGMRNNRLIGMDGASLIGQAGGNMRR